MPKSKKIPNPYAKVDASDGHSAFAPLTDRQATSKTFQSLSDSAKVTLMICKL